MRIAYCTNVRLPSERAHGHQIAQVCDALVQLGHDVTIFAPKRWNPVKEEYHSYYRSDARVKLHYLRAFDPNMHGISTGLPGLMFANWTTGCATRCALQTEPFDSAHGKQFDLLYTRAPALLGKLLQTGMPVVLELHQLPRFGLRRFARRCNKCAIVACLTSPMRDRLLELGVHPDRLIVEGDAVDLARFQNLPSREEARKALGVSTNRIVVGYVGRLKTLGMEKGVSHLLQALKKLQPFDSAHGKPEAKFFGLVVGGPDGDKQQYEAQARSLGLTEKDVRFTGEVSAHDVPAALAACDILAMPFPDLPHYRNHMSPLKMFEYMAANRVMITSDLPTVRDVLSEKTAVFCAPGDVQSLADALVFVANHSDEAKERAATARSLVERHTWLERMKRILSAAK
jgi:glycosyltransferase involved in cell wall biosynthesis